MLRGLLKASALGRSSRKLGAKHSRFHRFPATRMCGASSLNLHVPAVSCEMLFSRLFHQALCSRLTCPSMGVKTSVSIFVPSSDRVAHPHICVRLAYMLRLLETRERGDANGRATCALVHVYRSRRESVRCISPVGRKLVRQDAPFRINGIRHSCLFVCSDTAMSHLSFAIPSLHA